MGVIDTINGATPARDTVTLVLDAALYAEVKAAEAALDDALAEDNQHASLAGDMPRYTAAVRHREALRDRIAASQVTFAFERIDPWTKVAIQAEHPPRPGNLVDLHRGYNVETYLPALVRGSCVSVTGADGDTETDIPDATWDHLLGVPAVEARDADDDQPAVEARDAIPGTLNSQQLQDLIEGATRVNDGSPVVPPSALSLLASQDSGESSAPPSPGTSPLDAGTAGSRPTSPTSSAGQPKTPKKAAAKKRSSGKSAAS